EREIEGLANAQQKAKLEQAREDARIAAITALNSADRKEQQEAFQKALQAQKDYDATEREIEGLANAQQKAKLEQAREDAKAKSLSPLPPLAPAAPAPSVAPAPAAPRAPAAPKAPSAPRPEPEKIPIGGTHGHLANDGKHYYRATSNAPLQIWDLESQTWSDVTKTFTFRVTDKNGDVIEDAVSVVGTSKPDALSKLNYPKGDYKIEDVTSPNLQVPKSGIGRTEVGADKDKIRLTLDGKYIGTYDESTLDKFDKMQNELNILENLKTKNKGLNENQLWQFYYNGNQYSDKETAEQLAKQLGIKIQSISTAGVTQEQKLKLPEQLIGINGEPTQVWRLADGRIIYDRKEYEDIVQKQYAERALNKQQLTSLNSIDEQDRQLAKNPKDNRIWFFDPSIREFKPITEPSYFKKEVIGRGEDKIVVLRKFETATDKQIETTIRKGDISASVDEGTIGKIREADKDGLRVYIETGLSAKGEIVSEATPDFRKWCEAKPECNLDLENNLKKSSYQNEFSEEREISPLIYRMEYTEEEIKLARNSIKIADKDGKTIAKYSFSSDYSIYSGTKTTEQSKTAYFFEGKEITKKEADELQKVGKTVIVQSDFPTYYSEEQRVDNELKYVTSRQYETQFDKDKKPIRVYEGTKVNQKTGRIEEFSYSDERGVFVAGIEGGIGFGTFPLFATPKYKQLGESNPALKSEFETRLKQLASRQFFSNVERVFTEFQGLSYLPTLFMDKDSLLKWRDSVDKAFATSYLGTEYWSSAICSSYLDGADEGRAYAETPQGLAQVGAHVEAARTEPITNGTRERIFIYKITFNVRNGDYAKDPRAPEEMNVNVVLKGERTANVFRQAQKVERGSAFGRIGRNAIVQESPALYTQICMTFDNVPLRWKLDNKEICNTILESSGAPTTITTPTATTTTSGGGATESEVNDF
ncbi:hypothetical protein HYX00_03385, partial [Candidatus Woesearchaeota archaeon]|nr:hypothetical protein [Candidatus Woesearchaeota archaeon]